MVIDYSKYYWKNPVITLRRPKENDWEYLVHHMFDSQGRFFFNEKIGFLVEGVQKDMYYHEGMYWNQVICGMTGAHFFENEKRLCNLY